MNIFLIAHNNLGDYESWHELFRLRLQANGTRLTTCSWLVATEAKTAVNAASQFTPDDCNERALGLQAIRFDHSANDGAALMIDDEALAWLAAIRSRMPTGEGSSFI